MSFNNRYTVSGPQGAREFSLPPHLHALIEAQVAAQMGRPVPAGPTPSRKAKVDLAAMAGKAMPTSTAPIGKQNPGTTEAQRPTPVVPFESGNFVAMLAQKGHEGEISHMYLDTKGLVTVGIGLQLATVQQAQNLPFFHKSDPSKRASPQEIKTEFRRIQAASSGTNISAESFVQKTTLVIDPQVGRQEAIRRVDENYWKAVHHLGLADVVDSLPLKANWALADIAYNAGPGKVTSGPNGEVRTGAARFTAFAKALRDFDFARAAEESSLITPNQKLNDIRRQWLLDLAKHYSRNSN